jgi:hypothetical protein
MHQWTDEDACFAAAQWASGIKQREIGAAFGYKSAWAVCTQIGGFISKYGPSLYAEPNQHGYRHKACDGERRALVRPAIAEFVKQRNARLDP